jgi:hypothetical protein
VNAGAGAETQPAQVIVDLEPFGYR